MTPDAGEFMGRFLMHVLPKGFRRIRHFGFLANACRAGKLARIRAALDVPEPAPIPEAADYRERYAMLTGDRPVHMLRGRMIDIGSWPRRSSTAHPPTPRCDSS